MTFGLDLLFVHMASCYIDLFMSLLDLQGGKIRDTLFQILEKEEGVIIKHGAQSRESRRAASQGMHTSKFCLHPAGDTPSACRLFDAIVSLCIPVIVSDSIELPFEDTIDYRKIAVFVETAPAIKPGYLVSILRGMTADRILEYQKELKEVGSRAGIVYFCDKICGCFYYLLFYFPYCIFINISESMTALIHSMTILFLAISKKKVWQFW